MFLHLKWLPLSFHLGCTWPGTPRGSGQPRRCGHCHRRKGTGNTPPHEDHLQVRPDLWHAKNKRYRPIFKSGSPIQASIVTLLLDLTFLFIWSLTVTSPVGIGSMNPITLGNLIKKSFIKHLNGYLSAWYPESLSVISYVVMVSVPVASINPTVTLGWRSPLHDPLLTLQVAPFATLIWLADITMATGFSWSI